MTRREIAKAMASVMLACVLASAAPPPSAQEVHHLIPLPRDLKKEMRALQYILSPDELNEFVNLYDDNMRRDWIEAYWRKRDPQFTSPENEMRMEHDRRIAHAESAFAINVWPGWDERGEVYIRYGEPTARQIVAAEVNRAGIDQAMEVWTYAKHNMIVRFEDAYGNGRYTYTMGDVEAGGSPRMRNIGDDIDAVFDAARGGGEPVVRDLIAESEYEQTAKMVNNFQVTLEEYPSSYPFNFEDWRVPIAYSVENFRGGAGIDRVEVNVEFVADAAEDESIDGAKAYEAATVFWDIDRREVGRDSTIVRVPIAPGESRPTLAQLVVSLPPAFYHLAVSIEEVETGRFTALRDMATSPDFDSKLAVSDILFARRITDNTGEPSPYNRGPLEVVPHPSRRYQLTDAVPVYFEVYNLGVGTDGRSRYSVEYRIESRRTEKKGFWSRLFSRDDPVAIASTFFGTGRGSEDHVNISVRADNLWEGEFDFKVTVRDQIGGTEASCKRVFSIVPAGDEVSEE